MTSVSTRIVGAQHHEGAQTRLNVLRRDNPVELRREPDNPHDPSAIACLSGGVMLGYIRAKDNRHAAAAMDRGEPVTCRVFPHQPMAQLTWPSVVSVAEAASLRKMARA